MDTLTIAYDVITEIVAIGYLIKTVSNRSAARLSLVEEDQRMVLVVEVAYLSPHERVGIGSEVIHHIRDLPMRCSCEDIFTE